MSNYHCCSFLSQLTDRRREKADSLGPVPQAAVSINTVPFTQMQGAGMVPGGSVSPTINGESHTINASKVFGSMTVDFKDKC